MTKTIIASLIAVGFATSAFASDASEVLHQDQANQAAVQQHYVAGSQAYAYAPAQSNGYTAAEQREFNRVDAATVSSR
jgi:opacity protein-like surface antigen